MSQATNGNTVKVQYTGKLENGEVFDSSINRDPLKFIIGDGSVIPGFEKGVAGMEVGESKTITIPPEEAYGMRHEEFVVNVERGDFPENIKPAVGLQLRMNQPDGKSINVMITDLSEDTVTLDANHPLAGHTLFFDVELVEIS